MILLEMKQKSNIQALQQISVSLASFVFLL